MAERRMILLALALIVLAAALAGSIYGGFQAGSSSPGNLFEAAPDLTAPTLTGATVEKYQGGIPGYIGASRRLYAYARVTDSGNPASGLASVEAKLGSPSDAFGLESGAWTIAGGEYDRGSEEQAIPAGSVNPGPNPYSVFAEDNAGNSATTGGLDFQYDPVAPASGDVTIANGGGTAGIPDAGDTITYAIDEPVDPSSLIGDWELAPGQRFPVEWDGPARPVTVEMRSPADYGGGAGDPIRIAVFDGTGTTPINLGTLHVWSNMWTVDCVARFESSMMEMRSDDEKIVVTLGGLTPSGSIVAPPPSSPEGCP